MSEHIQQVREFHNIDGTRTRSTKVVDRSARSDEVDKAQRTQFTIANIIWFVAGVLLVLLGFRFVFALLGANPANGFADFIYTTSHPFVAPFFSLFSYRLEYGVSRFELDTLFAMIVYALIAFALVRLVTINRPTIHDDAIRS